MKIIKRSGVEVDFDINKIIEAMKKANNEVIDSEKLTDEKILELANNVSKKCKKAKYSLNVEEIQNLVEDELMNINAFNIARKYIISFYVI